MASLTVLVGALVQLQVTEVPAGLHDPFDMDAISCSGTFVGPIGDPIEAGCFYFQNYTEGKPGDWGQLNPVGPPVYLVRFSPQARGDWKYVTTFNGTTTSSGSLSVLPDSAAAGFVTVSPSSPTHFAFTGADGGQNEDAAYTPMGENNCWGSQETYTTWWNTLGPMGVNYTRIWLGGFSDFTLQQGSAPVGQFDQQASWRLDLVLSMAREHGIYAMLSLHTFQAFRTSQYEACWPGCNPYSQLVGTPGAFFGDSTCRQFTRRYFQYLVNRYGWDTAVMSWELWNEVDGIQNYDVASVQSWHSWAAAQLHALDNRTGRPVTTSFAQGPGAPSIDSLPGMDYTQTHAYNENDFALSNFEWDSGKATAYNKPTYMGEFGQANPSVANYDDPTGIEIANGLLTPWFSGGAGSADTWWWDNWIAPHNLYWRWAWPCSFVAQAVNPIWTGRGAWSNVTVASPQPGAMDAWLTQSGDGSAGLLWARNVDYAWKPQLQCNQCQPPQIGGVQGFQIAGFQPHTSYNATWWPVDVSDPSFLRSASDHPAVRQVPASMAGSLVTPGNVTIESVPVLGDVLETDSAGVLTVDIPTSNYGTMLVAVAV